MSDCFCEFASYNLRAMIVDVFTHFYIYHHEPPFTTTLKIWYTSQNNKIEPLIHRAALPLQGGFQTPIGLEPISRLPNNDSVR